MALEQYKAIKNRIYEENHTDRPHNMNTYSRDVHHTWTETVKSSDAFNSTLLVGNIDRPEFAKRRWYLLSSLLGMSWYTRAKFMKRTNQAHFQVAK